MNFTNPPLLKNNKVCLGITEIGKIVAVVVGARNVHNKKRTALNNVVRNRLEQCCAANIVHSCMSTVLFSVVIPDLDTTILFHIVDNCEQCGQINIVQSCYTASSEFLGVYTAKKRTTCCNIRDLTILRRQRDDDGYEYNVIHNN